MSGIKESTNMQKVRRIRPISKKVRQEMRDRIAACGRKDSDQVIYVGELVEKVMKSEFGVILEALTAGRTTFEIGANRNSALSCDRVLGRIEMASLLFEDLEQFILDKDALLRPIEQPSNDTFSTTEPLDYTRKSEQFTFHP